MTHLEQSSDVMPLPDLIQWEDWHAQVIARKEVLLGNLGETKNRSCDELRKAELEAMRQIRAERKARTGAYSGTH